MLILWWFIFAHYNYRNLKSIAEAQVAKFVLNHGELIFQDGKVYVCGMKGAILAGRHNDFRQIHWLDHRDNWKPVNDCPYNFDIWGAEWFNGFLYVATKRGLFRLNGDHLEPVDFSKMKLKKQPASFYHLSSHNDIMWSIGVENDLLSFDGKNWERII